MRKLQEEALFTGEYDSGPAVVGVHAGAGGTDSQDWAEMLLRMYLRWAEARGLKAQLLEATPGEEAGLKSATFTLVGPNAYGIMPARLWRGERSALDPLGVALVARSGRRLRLGDGVEVTVESVDRARGRIAVRGIQTA